MRLSIWQHRQGTEARIGRSTVDTYNNDNLFDVAKFYSSTKLMLVLTDIQISEKFHPTLIQFQSDFINKDQLSFHFSVSLILLFSNHITP